MVTIHSSTSYYLLITDMIEINIKKLFGFGGSSNPSGSTNKLVLVVT
jgi:hypothetical protein